jgi:replicative DNA helicase
MKKPGCLHRAKLTELMQSYANPADGQDELPPHSLEAEQGILGCILLSPVECLGECLQQIKGGPAEFYDLRHRSIYETMQEMYASKVPVDTITLQQRLKAKQMLDSVGGLAFLSALPDSVPSAANLGYYLTIVRQHFNLRSLQQAVAGAHLQTIQVRDNPDNFGAIVRKLTADLRGFEDADASAIPEAHTIGQLHTPAANDECELLKFRFLCRGGGMLLVGQTGVGKSSLSMQAQILWALGQDCFGIAPARALKSLVIQAENDEGDMAEMRDGVLAGLKLTSGELRRLDASIVIRDECSLTGQRFFDSARKLLAHHRPDLFWIDPALAYIGGEAGKQSDVTSFLRNMLNPLLKEFNCGGIVVTHTNKPAGKDKPDWSATDFAYSGTGSIEWANWARAVLVLRSIGSDRVYQLRAGKRGSRIGWKEQDGQTTAYTRLIAHADQPGVICWREANENEAPGANGKPVFKASDITPHVPVDKPVSKITLKNKVNGIGCGLNRFEALLSELIDDGVLFEWKTPRPRTNPLIQIARKPQPEASL